MTDEELIEEVKKLSIDYAKMSEREQGLFDLLDELTALVKRLQDQYGEAFEAQAKVNASMVASLKCLGQVVFPDEKRSSLLTRLLRKIRGVS